MRKRKPERCEGCPWFEAPGPVVLRGEEVTGEGPEGARLAFVAEAPGAEELARNANLVGPAGRVFELVLKLAGVDRKACWVANTVRCVVLGGSEGPKPPLEVVEFCTERWLWPELERIKPNVVVALGEVAFRALTRETRKFEVARWRGALKECAQFVGKKPGVL